MDLALVRPQRPDHFNEVHQTEATGTVTTLHEIPTTSAGAAHLTRGSPA